MQRYFVRSPGIASDARELHAALVRLRDFESTSSGLRVRWLHGYAMREADGRFGLACVFQADGTRSLDRHADATRIPAAEILPVVQTRVVRRFAPTMVYLIRRRAAWTTHAELERAVETAHRVVGEATKNGVSWLRSYAVREDDGSFGAWCLYQAVGPQALHEHAGQAGRPADAVTQVIGRIVYRGDGDEDTIAADAVATDISIH